MPTLEQLEEFRRRARQAGFSEEEIEQKVSSRQATKPTTAPSPQLVQEPKRTGFLGFADKTAGFLAPRTKGLLTKVSAGLGTKGFATKLPGIEEKREERRKQAEELIRQSKQEQDPTKRRQLINQANTLAGESVSEIRGVGEEFKRRTGEEITAKDRPIAEAVGVAGEVGTFLLPVGKLASGAKLTTRILRGAKLGAVAGGIHGITDPSELTPGERAKRTLTGAGVGALAGGAVSAAFELPRAAVKRFLGAGGGNLRRVARLFRMSPSERAKFRQSTGGLNFEEEILARDGRAIAGKSYEELLEHFSTRADDANTNVSDLLSKSDKTINRKGLMAAIQKRISSLAPEKGNVGTAGAIQQLQGVLDDLSKLPDDEIAVATANNIKQQLQKLGAAAFSPSGKATTASEALAGASGTVKRAIEKVEGKARPFNKSIQLYNAARRAIEKTGDREFTKISNSIGQKFIQMIPAAGAAGAGIGGFAVGGPAGGLGGVALATALIGGAGAARVKLLSPEMQTKMISKFSSVLASKGVISADAAATRIMQEISKQVARNATLESPRVEGADVVSPAGEPTLEGGMQMFATPQPQVTQPEGGIAQPSPQQVQGVPGQETQRGDQDQAHTPSVGGTITIRNKQTGETKTVQRGELGQFGISTGQESAIPGLPNKAQILAAMVVDLQSGGKNISELNTLLNAHEKLLPQPEKLSAAQKKRLVELERAQTTVDMVADLAERAGVGVGAKAKSIFGRFPGVEGGAEEDLDRVTDGLARAIAGTLAGEVGIATDRDIIRWKGLMPKVSDTLAERRRVMERLRSALKNERARLSVPDPATLSATTPQSLFPMQGGAAAL